MLLRLVNDLLRRLSKSRHAAFCGRIRTFLAKAISITDRSGVNQAGLSNVEAAVEPDPAVPLPQDIPGQEDGELEAADRMETDDGVDARLYHSFWGLQTFFSNPRLCYEAPVLVKMSQALSLVLDHFAANPVDDYGDATSTAAPPLKRKRGDGNDEPLLAPLTRSEHFFPKYLASASLFDLELRSAPLRRQVLLQALLLLDHLLDCTPERKLQLASAPNKSMVPSLVLTDAMVRASFPLALLALTRRLSELRRRASCALCGCKHAASSSTRRPTVTSFCGW